ncbi:MAG: hypothetical protein J7L66_00175 [Anaerolineaceae bacterium]|nr:hypothetical protein [Anaerolineaceae bacterium]
MMHKSIKITLFLVFSLLILTTAVEAAYVRGPVLAQGPTPIPIEPGAIQPGKLPCDPFQVHGLYFFSQDCPHCMVVLNDLIYPLQK